ncbi:MAG: fluoride efflux transporter CrcB [Alphaproteobacteria bacterium]|nr:fluoride efflux transporter CrcB [Alphaproteobacteria bacterium]
MNSLHLMYVAFGGAAGAMSRYLLVELVSRMSAAGFPYGTLAVNVLGSFLLGALVAMIALVMPGRGKELHLILAVGFLGGFTTFSAFSMDSYMLMERGLYNQAFFYVFGSVVMSVLALIAGMWLVRSLAT